MYSPLPTDNAAWQRAGSLIRRARQVIEMRNARQDMIRLWFECARRSSWVRGSQLEPALSGSSSDGPQRRQPTDAFETTGLADFKPWREAGWIFRDGVCVVIERQGPLSRARAVVE